MPETLVWPPLSQYHVPMTEERIGAEIEVITGIAEALQREQPGKTITQLWAQALSIYRTQFESKMVPQPNSDSESEI